MNLYFISKKYKYVKSNKSPFIYKVNTKKSYFDYRISGITRRLPFIQKKKVGEKIRHGYTLRVKLPTTASHVQNLHILNITRNGYDSAIKR